MESEAPPYPDVELETSDDLLAGLLVQVWIASDFKQLMSRPIDKLLADAAASRQVTSIDRSRIDHVVGTDFGLEVALEPIVKPGTWLAHFPMVDWQRKWEPVDLDAFFEYLKTQVSPAEFERLKVS